MTDIIEPHGPQGNAPPPGKRPWKAPRLLDLDDDGPEGMTGQFVMNTHAGSKRYRATERVQDLGDIKIYSGPS